MSPDPSSQNAPAREQREDARFDGLAQRVAMRAHPAFNRSGWVYGADTQPPTQERLAQTVRRLLDMARDSDRYTPEDGITVSSGRFHVSRFVEDDREVYSVALEVGCMEDSRVS